MAPSSMLGLCICQCEAGQLYCMAVLCLLLIQTHDNLEHLAMMERILGAIPHRMIRRSKYVVF